MRGDRERADAERAARQVRQLRAAHPGWTIWHSSNIGFRGFYATRADGHGGKLHAETPESLTRQIEHAG